MQLKCLVLGELQQQQTHAQMANSSSRGEFQNFDGQLFKSVLCFFIGIVSSSCIAANNFAMPNGFLHTCIQGIHSDFYVPELTPLLVASSLLMVMNDSPQPHYPLEFGLINMNSDLIIPNKDVWDFSRQHKKVNCSTIHEEMRNNITLPWNKVNSEANL